MPAAIVAAMRSYCSEIAEKRRKRNASADVTSRNTKLRKIFESEPSPKRKFGSRRGLKIIDHIAYSRKEPSLAMVSAGRPYRCHQLSGDRDEQFAIDLVHSIRLAFEVARDPISRDGFGGIDKERMTAIMAMEVTHCR